MKDYSIQESNSWSQGYRYSPNGTTQSTAYNIQQNTDQQEDKTTSYLEEVCFSPRTEHSKILCECKLPECPNCSIGTSQSNATSGIQQSIDQQDSKTSSNLEEVCFPPRTEPSKIPCACKLPECPNCSTGTSQSNATSSSQQDADPEKNKLRLLLVSNSSGPPKYVLPQGTDSSKTSCKFQLPNWPHCLKNTTHNDATPSIQQDAGLQNKGFKLLFITNSSNLQKCLVPQGADTTNISTKCQLPVCPIVPQVTSQGEVKTSTQHSIDSQISKSQHNLKHNFKLPCVCQLPGCRRNRSLSSQSKVTSKIKQDNDLQKPKFNKLPKSSLTKSTEPSPRLCECKLPGCTDCLNRNMQSNMTSNIQTDIDPQTGKVNPPIFARPSDLQERNYTQGTEPSKILPNKILLLCECKLPECPHCSNVKPHSNATSSIQQDTPGQNMELKRLLFGIPSSLPKFPLLQGTDPIKKSCECQVPRCTHSSNETTQRNTTPIIQANTEQQKSEVKLPMFAQLLDLEKYDRPHCSNVTKSACKCALPGCLYCTKNDNSLSDKPLKIQPKFLNYTVYKKPDVTKQSSLPPGTDACKIPSYVYSRRGSPMVLRRGYSHYYRYTSKATRTEYWACSSHKLKGCKASLRILNGVVEFEQSTHNHPPVRNWTVNKPEKKKRKS